MSKTNDKTTRMVSVIGVFAILFSASAIVSSTIIQQKSAYGMDKNMTTEETTSRATELKQHLSNSNVPVTLPLIKGYVKGHEVFYITTEASVKTVADHLTNITNSRVVYSPSLKNAPAGALANIYEFKNGVRGLVQKDFNLTLPIRNQAIEDIVLFGELISWNGSRELPQGS